MELEKIKIRWCRHHVLCLRRQLVLLLVARHHDHKKKLKKRTWKRLPPSLREAFLWFSSCIRARCLWHGGKISRNVAVVILVSGLYLFIPPPLFLCLQWGLLCSTDVWGGNCVLVRSCDAGVSAAALRLCVSCVCARAPYAFLLQECRGDMASWFSILAPHVHTCVRGLRGLRRTVRGNVLNVKYHSAHTFLAIRFGKFSIFKQNNR